VPGVIFVPGVICVLALYRAGSLAVAFRAGGCWEDVRPVDCCLEDVRLVNYRSEVVLQVAGYPEVCVSVDAPLEDDCPAADIRAVDGPADGNEVDANDCSAKVEWTEPNQHPLP